MSEPIQYRNIAELRTSPNNYRRGDIGAIITSIITFGFNNALRVWQGGIVKAGNHTLLAIQSIKAQGLNAPQNVQVRGNEWLVPCIDISHLSQTEADAFLIADNRLSEIAENDDTQLAALLSAIASEDETLLRASGYDGDDLDALLQTLADDALAGVQVTDVEPQIDKADELREKYSVELGQVWQLGRHKVACIDSTDESQVKAFLKDIAVNMVFADPPYGVSVVRENKVGAVFAKSVAKKGQYTPVIGDETIDTALKSSAMCLSLYPKANHIWWGSNYYAHCLPPSSGWVVWDKRDGTEIDNTFADFELAWTSVSTKARMYRQLWNGMIRAGEHEKRVHPTQKPVELARWCFAEFGKDNDVIFDPFAGSGITVIAGEQLNRTVYACELSPEYIAVIIQRWVDLTGLQPRLSNL